MLCLGAVLLRGSTTPGRSGGGRVSRSEKESAKRKEIQSRPDAEKAAAPRLTGTGGSRRCGGRPGSGSIPVPLSSPGVLRACPATDGSSQLASEELVRCCVAARAASPRRNRPPRPGARRRRRGWILIHLCQAGCCRGISRIPARTRSCGGCRVQERESVPPRDQHAATHHLLGTVPS